MALVTTAECRLFLCRALFFQCVHDLVIHHLVGVIAVVGKDGDAAVRESVTLTRDGVMDELAADFAGDMLDDAALFAKFSKENRTAAQKLLDSLKEFLNKVRGLFTGKYRDMAAQEAYGKDFAELEDISKQWQAAFDAAERQAEKAKTAAGEGDGARYSLKKSGIDKYYARQIDQWDGKDHGGAFRVGAVSDALLKVGVPDVDIWFDQSKAAKQLEGKSKITKDVLKQIPEVLESPVAISESYDNTVMVFGQLFDGGGNPIVVAIRISSTNRRNHISIVNKSRSVGTRSHNLDALLADDKLLYLGENKKETKKWFNALGRSTPFGGTKFGLIRSISNPVENVKPKFSLKAIWWSATETRSFISTNLSRFFAPSASHHLSDCTIPCTVPAWARASWPTCRKRRCAPSGTAHRSFRSPPRPSPHGRPCRRTYPASVRGAMPSTTRSMIWGFGALLPLSIIGTEHR